MDRIDNSKDGEWGTPFARQAFDAVRMDAYRFRHRCTEWDREQALRRAERKLRDFLASNRHAELSASEYVAIPKRVIDWVAENVNPRPRRYNVGAGALNRKESILTFAAKYFADYGVRLTIRQIAERMETSYGSVQRAMKIETLKHDARNAMLVMDVDVRILRAILYASFRSDRLVCFAASDLAARLWGDRDKERWGDLDRPLSIAAAGLNVNAVRYGPTIAFYPLLVKLPMEAIRQLVPTDPVPTETPLQAYLRDGPLFSSEEAIDLWAINRIGSGEAFNEEYERIINFFNLLRPDRAFVHVKRSLITDSQFEHGLETAQFVAQGLRTAVKKAEISEWERVEWPVIANFLCSTGAMNDDSPGLWLASTRILANHWGSRGKAASRRGEFLMHLLCYPAGTSLLHQYRELELAGRWSFDPTISDRENCSNDAFYDRWCELNLTEFERESG